MKKYLDALKKELVKQGINENEIKEILSDHESMINEAIQEGVNEEKLNELFGDPKKLAKELKLDEKEEVIVVSEKNLDGYTVFEEFSLVENLEKVSIQLVSVDVHYDVHEEDKVVVYSKKLKNPEEYSAVLEDGEFVLKRLKGKKIFNFGFSSSSATFQVFVPKHFDLKEFSLAIVSGDAFLSNVIAKEVALKTTSGDLKLANLQGDEVNITTVSGDAKVELLRTKELDLNAVSGDFQVINAEVEGNVSINTVSGDFKIHDASSGLVDFKTVSGDLKGKEFYPTKINLKSVSGDVRIENEDKERTIEVGHKKTLSGEIKIK